MKFIVRSLTLALALVATALSPTVQAAGGHGGSGGGHGGGGSSGGHGGGGYSGGHGGGGYSGGHGGYGGGYGGHASGWYGGYGHGWGGYGLGIGYGYYGGGFGYYAPYYYDVEPETVLVVPQAAQAAQPVPKVSRAPDPIFYPRNGQSAATEESDRVECNRWATTQRGAKNDASIFLRATVACMEGRGYTVR